MKSTAELYLDVVDRIGRDEAAANRRAGERPLDIADRAELARAQRRADAVYQTLSKGAPVARANEPALVYRVRVATDLQKHSREWARVDLARIASSDPNSFTRIETQILAAAQARGLDPHYKGDLPPGQMRERVVVEPDGSRITYYHGDWHDCFGQFGPPAVTAVKSFSEPLGPGIRRQIYPKR